MIIIRNIKLKNDDENELKKKISKMIGMKNFNYEIYRKSIDARKGILFNYQVIVYVDLSDKKIKSIKNCERYHEEDFNLEDVDNSKSVTVVGSGPAGLFCAYLLAKNGAKVKVIERGSEVSKRVEDINKFLDTGKLNTNSNVQFGEGGAGTFSDGKLTARSKDKRVREVLKTFVDYGAPSEIMYDSKPHIGTDELQKVIVNMRNDLIKMGCEFEFDTLIDNLEIENEKCVGIKSHNRKFQSDCYVLALGNSSRDTVMMLADKIKMTNKPFAVGFRIEHPQKMIDFAQYKCDRDLPSATYQLSYSEENKRGVYTFCMCPGGYVINASSEENELCVNGMSFHKRDGKNANSAIVCGIDEDTYGHNLLDGIRFQQEIERKAFELGGSNYNAPVQLVKDFMDDKKSEKIGEVEPTVKPGYVLSNLNDIYPEHVTNYIKTAIKMMDNKLHGFSMDDAILTGVETRTSCAVRMDRDDLLRSENVDNLYVIGEGSGYSGGIVSSAIDGLKAAEVILTSKLSK